MGAALVSGEPKQPKYVEFDPEKGYPAGQSLRYECVLCGDTMPSFPSEYVECKCGNLSIDVDAGRLSVENPITIKLYEADER